MNDDNKLLKQAKIQKFELIELLFREYISSHIVRPDIDYSFQARLQSFINQISSYLHSSGKPGFFTHFFFGSFASLLDTELAEKLGIQKLYFNFNKDHLRMIAATDAKTHVFIFIENNQNNKQNKNKDIGFTKAEWKILKGKAYSNDDNEKLEISVIQINKSKGSINVTVEKQDIQNAIYNSRCCYHEIIKQCVDKNGQYIFFEKKISALSVGETAKSIKSIEFILDYTKKIHDFYKGLVLYGYGAQEADQHGFVAGIFNNFRYRYNAHVYLEQFAGRGYADIVLLVRGADRSTKSIPIIIELKAGSGIGTTSDNALKQAIEYTEGFQPNNMRILTLADNILCVGINLDSSVDSFMQMKVVKRDQEIVPLIQNIVDFASHAARNIHGTNQDIIKQKIKIHLKKTYNTFPGTGEKSSAHYMSRFILGESLMLHDYDKHIFIYDKKSYIPTATVINEHSTRSKKRKIEKIVDGSNAVNSILFIPTSSADSPAILVNIIDVNRNVLVNNIRLENRLIGNRKIVQLNIQFNIDKYKESFEEYCKINLLKIYGSISEYNQASVAVKGQLYLVDEEVSNNLLEHLQQTISSQKGLVISDSRYKELFGKIGGIVYPIKSLIGRESEFQGLLEGIFKYYSDVSLSEGVERRVLVLTEFQTGAGVRIDMLMQAIGPSKQGTKEYVTVGLELKYDDSVKISPFDKKQDENIQRLILRHKEQVLVRKLLNNQIEKYAKGAAIKSITDSNKVAIMGLVFNKQAKDENSLLLTTERFFEADIVHSSKLYSISNNFDVPSINDLPKPDSARFIPDWVEQEVLDLFAKAQGEDDDILCLSNSLLDNKKIKKLQDLLSINTRLLQRVNGIDLSFNAVTASNVKELIKKFRQLIYLDLSDNDLTNNFLNFKEMIQDIQVPLLKISDVGMNDAQMGETFSILAEDDKISDLEIKHLDDKQQMSSNTAHEIRNYLIGTESLESLTLERTKIGNEAINIIAQGLKEQRTLNSLVLTENSIRVQGAKKLGNVLKDSVISHIDLSGNPLGVFGLKAIVNSLKNAENIKSIELVNVRLIYNRYDIDEDDGKKSRTLITSLRSLCENPHLTKIDISYNNIGNGALSNIFDVLSTVGNDHNLQDLSLAGNKIDWGAHLATIETLKAYMYNFLSNNKKIRSLSLALMDIDDNIGNILVSALEKNFSLIHLDLEGNSLTSKTIKGLASILRTNQYLQYLNLSSNNLNIKDLKMILESMKINPVISHINLSGNDFSEYIITNLDGTQNIDLDYQDIDFMRYLQSNTELKYLNLSKCKLNQKSLESLFKTIANNPVLEVLNINGNTIDSSIVDSIVVESLNNNANQGLEIGLKVLHISQGSLKYSTINKLMQMKSLGISVLVDEVILSNDSLEDKVMQTSIIDPVDKNSAVELDIGHLTFESETRRGNYHYWLQAHDIIDIARVHYNYNNRPIEIIGSINQLSIVITRYSANINATLLSLILNIGNNNSANGTHWVSLVLNRVGSSNHGYYVDSLGGNIAGNIASILSKHRILIHNFSNQQQKDGYNCGLWALENSKIICEVIEAGEAVSNEQISRSITGSRSEEEFERIRDNILKELINDNQRRKNLEHMGLDQVELPQILDEDSQDPIIATCLPGKAKRSINACKIGWSDVDEISISKTRKSKEIIIDSKKFLAYSKKNIGDEEKSLQLVRLAETIQNKAVGKIVGEYKGLFNGVIEAGGYKNYIQQERIKDLGLYVINSDKHNISPAFKLKLINAVGKVQLIRGIHSTIVLCQDEITSSCALSVSGLGYSFLSQPIENMMVKFVPKIVENTISVTSKLAPKLFLYDTKFILQTLGAKYGTTIAKGGAGAIASIFDIVYIGIASNILIECNKKTNSNPCTDKEIRDNAASIIFSSVSFIAGVGLTAASAPLAATGVGLGLMGGYAIYSGVSNIIEYEEKYDTTHDENWSIFWRTILFQDMAIDIQHLATRQEIVNNIIMTAWSNLEASPDNVVAYATGLGRIELDYAPRCETVTDYFPVYCIGKRPQEGPCKDGRDGWIAKNVTKCTIRSQYITQLHSAYSSINMQKQDIKYTKNLSRVLPNSIENATMICLPQITNADYEKDIKKSVPTAIYYCDNAVVIVNNQRKSLKHNDQWSIYDLRYINTGILIGSRELYNMFLLSDGNTKIVGGDNTTSKFVFTSDKFLGQIHFGSNSTNIFSTEQLTNEIIDFKVTNIYLSDIGYSQIILNDRSFAVRYFRYDDAKLYYVGRKNKIDNVVCEPFHLTNVHYPGEYHIPAPHIYIDSGGGYSNDRKDLIEGCNIAVVQPFTKVTGGDSTYIFYVKTKNYKSHVSSSIIDVRGNGTITFPEISLLKDCNRITYSTVSNTLSFEIPLEKNGTFTLDVKNYLDRKNNANFILKDKDGSNIVYQHILSNTQIKHFILYIECRFNTVREVVEHYRNISYSREDYTVFSTVKNTQYNNCFQFGSSERDIMIIDKDVVYVEGNNGSDLYIIDANIDYPIDVNNKAIDLLLDILKLPVNNISMILLIEENNNLRLCFNKKNEIEDNKYQDIQQEVIIDNYFQDNIYRHIAIMDRNNNSYIAFKQNDVITLLPFYHASLEKNIFILSPNSKGIIIDIDVNNIMLNKQGSNLLLTEKEDHSFNRLNIILRDYYKDKKQWLDTKLYSYSNNGGISNIIDLSNIAISTINDQEQYNSIIKEYVVDLSKQSYYINYNYIIYDDNHQLLNNPITVEPSDEIVWLVIFKNMPLKRLVISDVSESISIIDKLYNNSLIIDHWRKNSKYQISMFEFDTGLNQERIPVLNDTVTRIQLNNVLDTQIKKIDIKVVKAVIDFLKLSCTKYNKQGNLSEEFRYNFLEEELSYRIGDSNNQNYSLEEVREYFLSSGNDIAGEGLLLLMFKLYNELLIKYPYVRRKDLHKIDNSCFQTVVSPNKSEIMIDNLNDSTNFSRIEHNIHQFINSNKQEIQQVITQLAELYSTNIVDIAQNSHYKHRHHHGENTNRAEHHGDNKHIRGHNIVRRDIEEELKIEKNNHDDIAVAVSDIDVMSSSSSGNSVKPIDYNMIKWIKNTWASINCHPIEQIKNLFNIGDVKEKVKIHDTEVLDNMGCRNNQNQQDDLVNKLSIIQSIEAEIIELEDSKIVETKLLRALNKQLKIVEEECRYDEQEEYEEELSSRLLTLTKRKVDIQKQYAKAEQIVIIEEINNEIEKIKQSIQENEQLNSNYFCEIETVKAMVLRDDITELCYEDIIKDLTRKIKDCEEEDIRLTNALQALEIQQEEYYKLGSILGERFLSKIEALNIEEKEILQEEALVIMYRNIQDQKSEVSHLKDQVKLQESKIESLKNRLNALNDHLATLDTRDSNLSWHDELSYWNETVDAKKDTTDQVSQLVNNSINLTSLSNGFIGNDTYQNQVLDYNSFDVQGNLLLLNLLMHKKNEGKYNSQKAMIDSREVDTEYAQNLAYNAYAPYGAENEEDMELIGAS